MYWKSEQQEDTFDERTAKRKCLLKGFDNFQDLIYVDSAINWIWYDNYINLNNGEI